MNFGKREATRAAGGIRSAELTGLDLVRHKPSQVKVAQHKPFKAPPPRSHEVEAIKVHHLVPGRYKIMDELLLRVRTAIGFNQSP